MDKKFDERTASKLYRDGLIDSDIAKRLGVSQTLICRWRNRAGLEPNRSRIHEASVYHDPPPPKPRKKILRNCTTCGNAECRKKWRAVTWRNCKHWEMGEKPWEGTK